MLDFFRKHGLITSEVFRYLERSKNFEKKIFHNCAKNFHLRENVLTVETRCSRYREI